MLSAGSHAGTTVSATLAACRRIEGGPIRVMATGRDHDISMLGRNTPKRVELDALSTGSGDADGDAIKAELTEIAAGIETMSGAPVADSAASRAAAFIDGSEEGYRHAAEALTIGLSAAH